MWQQQIAEARKTKARVTSPLPIHCIAFVAALEGMKGTLNDAAHGQTSATLKEMITQYVAAAKTSSEELIANVKYFRKLQWYEAKKVNIVAHIENPESPSGKMWTVFEHYFNDKQAEFKQGIAPRNRKERQIIKNLTNIGHYNDRDMKADSDPYV